MSQSTYISCWSVLESNWWCTLDFRPCCILWMDEMEIKLCYIMMKCTTAHLSQCRLNHLLVTFWLLPAWPETVQRTSKNMKNMKCNCTNKHFLYSFGNSSAIMFISTSICLLVDSSCFLFTWHLSGHAHLLWRVSVQLFWSSLESNYCGYMCT